MASNPDWLDPRVADYLGQLPPLQLPPIGPSAQPQSASLAAPPQAPALPPPAPPPSQPQQVAMQPALAGLSAPVAPIQAPAAQPAKAPEQDDTAAMQAAPQTTPQAAPQTAPQTAPQDDNPKPGETADQYAARIRIKNQSDIGASFDQAVLGLKQLGANVAAFSGDALEDTAVGNAIGADKIREWGVDTSRDLEKQMAPYSEGRISQVEQIKGVGDLGRFAMWSVGQMAPSAIESIGMALVGAAAGTAAAGPVAGAATGIAGAVGSSAAKNFIAKRVTAAMADRVVNGAIVKGVTREVAEASAQKALAQTVGAGAAMFASSYAMGIGDIYGETMGEDGRGSVGMSALLAAPYAALDAFTDLSVFGSILKGTGGTSALGRFSKAMLTAGVKEGSAEAGQEGLLMLAGAQAGKEYTQGEVMSRLGNAAAMAFIGGGVMGIPAGRKGPTDQEREAGTLAALAAVGLATAGQPGLGQVLADARMDPAARLAAVGQVADALRADNLGDLADLWAPMAQKAIQAGQAIVPTSVRQVAEQGARAAAAAEQAALAAGKTQEEAEVAKQAVVTAAAEKAADLAKVHVKLGAGRPGYGAPAAPEVAGATGALGQGADKVLNEGAAPAGPITDAAKVASGITDTMGNRQPTIAEIMAKVTTGQGTTGVTNVNIGTPGAGGTRAAPAPTTETQTNVGRATEGPVPEPVAEAGRAVGAPETVEQPQLEWDRAQPVAGAPVTAPVDGPGLDVQKPEGNVPGMEPQAAPKDLGTQGVQVPATLESMGFPPADAGVKTKGEGGGSRLDIRRAARRGQAQGTAAPSDHAATTASPAQDQGKEPAAAPGGGTAAAVERVRDLTNDEAASLIQGKTEKPGGADFSKTVRSSRKQYSLERVPLSAFEFDADGRYDDTVDIGRATEYAKKPIETPILARVGRNGKYFVVDGGHRITAARIRNDSHVLAIVGRAAQPSQAAEPNTKPTRPKNKPAPWLAGWDAAERGDETAPAGSAQRNGWNAYRKAAGLDTPAPDAAATAPDAAAPTPETNANAETENQPSARGPEQGPAAAATPATPAEPTGAGPDAGVRPGVRAGVPGAQTDQAGGVSGEQGSAEPDTAAPAPKTLTTNLGPAELSDSRVDEDNIETAIYHGDNVSVVLLRDLDSGGLVSRKEYPMQDHKARAEADYRREKAPSAGPYAAPQPGHSTQYARYAKAIQAGDASVGMLEQIRVDDRLNDGEDEELLAMAAGMGVTLPLAATTPTQQTAAGPKPAKPFLVSDDRMAEIRKRLREKGRHLSSGVDPELFALGAELAVGNIERGIRKFADFARAAITDLGDWVKPYLRGWYENARYYPGLDTAGMTPVAEMDAEVEKAMAAGAAPTADDTTTDQGQDGTADEDQPAGRDGTQAPTKTAEVTQAQFDAAYRAVMDGDNVMAGVAAALGFDKYEKNTIEGKIVEEVAEAAYMKMYREIATSDDSETRRQQGIADIFETQPRLETRTGTSSANQAYSTPAPLAFAALRMVGAHDNPGVVMDNTAGTAALLMTADPDTAIANELDPGRANLLRLAGFQNVTENNALQWLPDTKVDVVATNPPFGAEHSKATLPDGSTYGTTRLEHAIVMRQLERLKPDGVAVIVVAGPNPRTLENNAAPADRAKHYTSDNAKNFNRDLRKWWNVIEHITVDGQLYKQMGAAWPVDVYIVAGRRDGSAVSEHTLPHNVNYLPRVIRTWEDLNALVQPVRERVDLARQQSADRFGGRADGAGQHSGAGGKAGGRPGGRSGRGRKTSVPKGGSVGATGKPEGATGPGGTGLPDKGVAVTGNRLPAAGNQPGGGGRTNTAGSGRDGVAPPPKGMADYPQQSKGTSLKTYVPEAHAPGIEAALKNLSARVGDLDDFVLEKLQYENAAELYAAFAGEQIDALALAIDNVDRDKGFIVADQTGVGKGRIVAGMIRYARLRGMVPVFMTEKPNLYVDMMRDLIDIGVDDLNPLLTNQNIYGKKALTMEDGRKLSRPKGNHTQTLARATEDWAGSGFDAIFTTYDQLNSAKGALTPRHELLTAVAPNAMFILDESHNAGGVGVTDEELERDAARGKNRLPREVYIRGLLAQAPAAVFSSATWAKRPQTMTLYAQNTDLSFLEHEGHSLAQTIEAGGVPMQQSISALMAESGQLMRREKSFEGIEFDAKTSYDVDTASADAAANTLAVIRDFDDEFAQPIVQALASARNSGGGNQRYSSVGFASVMHNLIDQAFTSLKADAIADHAIEILKRGEKLVLGIANTNETALKELVERDGVQVGGYVQFTLRDLYRRFLRNTLRYHVKDSSDPNDKGYHVWIDPETLTGDAARAYEHALAEIESIPADIPGSPIDHIHWRLREAGFKVGEITGRELGINYADGTLYKRPDTETGIQGRRTALMQFNGGMVDSPLPKTERLDALIINRAGATGASMHASDKFADQSPRSMLLAQYEKNIDTFMQMLGRVNRTGQVVPPRYYFPQSNIPAETRLHAVMAKKLTSLNANVTGSGKSAVGVDVPEFMNRHGSTAAEEVISNHEDMARRMGNISGSTDTEEYIHKVTGRVGLMEMAQQEQFYQELFAVYAGIVEQAKAMGLNVGAMDVLPLEARGVRRRLVVPATGDRPMQKAVYAYEIDAKLLSKPATIDGIKNEFIEFREAKGLAGNARQMGEQLAEEASDKYATFQEQETRKQLAVIPGRIAKAKREHEEAVKKAVEDGQPIPRWTDADEQKIRDKVQKDVDKRVADEDKVRDETIKKIKDLGPASLVVVRINQGGRRLHGVISRVERTGRARNPYQQNQWSVTIYLATHEPRRITAKLSEIGEGAKFKFAVDNDTTMDEVQEAFDKANEAVKSGRQKRVILTGNAPIAFQQFDGQITQFTDHTGKVGDGVLMPADMSGFNDLNRKALELRTGAEAMEYLRLVKDSGNPKKYEAGKNALEFDGVAAFFFNDDGTVTFRVTSDSGAARFRNKDVVSILTSAGMDFIRVKVWNTRIGSSSAPGQRQVWDVRVPFPSLLGKQPGDNARNEVLPKLVGAVVSLARNPVLPATQDGVKLVEKLKGLDALPAAEDVDGDESMVEAMQRSVVGGGEAVGPGPQTRRDQVLEALDGGGLNAEEREAVVRRALELYQSGDLTRTQYTQVRELLGQGKFRRVAEVLAEVERTGRQEGVAFQRVRKAKMETDMEQVLALIAQSAYKGGYVDVAVKETLQNSFDAVKAVARRKGGYGPGEQGRIRVVVDASRRLIIMDDNGLGMTPKEISEYFLTLGGTGKGGVNSSGGMGMAKGQFLAGSEWFRLETVKDGQASVLHATPGEVIRGDAQIVTDDAPKGEHGTRLTLKVPEYYRNSQGEQVYVGMWNSIENLDALTYPLIGPVEIEVSDSAGIFRDEAAGIPEDAAGKVLPLGIHFDPDAAGTPFYTKATFAWGEADIYFGSKQKERRIRHSVLSDGIFQFDWPINKPNTYDKIPYDITINIRSSVKTNDPRYPFNNTRQGFRPSIENDAKALAGYLADIAYGRSLDEIQQNFGAMKQLPRVQVQGAARELSAEAKAAAAKAMKEYVKDTPDRPKAPAAPASVTVADGKVEGVVEGVKKALFDMDAENRKQQEAKFAESMKAERDPSKEVAEVVLGEGVDRSKPVFHNNTNVDYIAEFGDEAAGFFAELGSVVVEFIETVGEIGGRWDYAPYKKDAAGSTVFGGVSIDKHYRGVHIRKPYTGIFVNPLAVGAARSLPGFAQSLYLTLVHEAAHQGRMGHDENHTLGIHDLFERLADRGTDIEYAEKIGNVLYRYRNVYNPMRERFNESGTRNAAQSLNSGADKGDATAQRILEGILAREPGRFAGARPGKPRAPSGGAVGFGGRPGAGLDGDPGGTDREGGVKYSRPVVGPQGKVPQGETPTGLPVAQVQAIADDFGARLLGASKGLVRVRVVSRQEDAFGPASRDQHGRVKGAFDGDTIILVAENLSTPAEIRALLRHESMHFAIAAMSKADRAEFFRRVIEAAGANRYIGKIKAEVEGLERTRYLAELADAETAADKAAVTAAYKQRLADGLIAEEVFARVAEAERSVVGQAWDRLLTWLRAKLRSLGLIQGPVGLTEMRALAASIARGIRAGRAGEFSAATPDIRFSFAGERAETVDLATDLADQSKFLADEAKARGFADPDEFLAKDAEGFMAMAADWRDGHPRMGADGGLRFSREAGPEAYSVKFYDDNENAIVFDNGTYRVSVDKVGAAEHAVLWAKENVKGKDYWAKRGSLNTYEATKRIDGVRGKYLGVQDVSIEKAHRGNGMAKHLYGALLQHAGDEIIGIASHVPSITNKAQVPSIHRGLGGKLSEDGDYVVITRTAQRMGADGGLRFSREAGDRGEMHAADKSTEKVVEYLQSLEDAPSGAVRLYRATARPGETGMRPWRSWTTEPETVAAYTANQGFGGQWVRWETVPEGRVLDLRDRRSGVDMERMARSLDENALDGMHPMDAADKWRAAGGRYPWEDDSRLRDALENTDYDFIRYYDDFPEFADTWVPLRDQQNTREAGDIRFSRGPATPTTTQDYANGVYDWFQRRKLPNAAKLTILNRTVGTPFNLAQRIPQFKRAWEAMSQQRDTRNNIALGAEALAPNTFADQEHGLKRGWHSALNVARRSRRREEALVQAALNEQVETKAGGSINRTFTDEELRERGLTKEMIATYRQRLKAAHYALDRSAQAIQVKNLWSLLKEIDPSPTKGAALTIETGRIARQILGGSTEEAKFNAEELLRPTIDLADQRIKSHTAYLQQVQKEVQDAKKALNAARAKPPSVQRAVAVRSAEKAWETAKDLEAKVANELDAATKLRERIGRFGERDMHGELVRPGTGALGAIEGIDEKVKTLKGRAYFPLMRFGKYTVTVYNQDGTTAFFGRYQSEDDAKAAEAELAPRLSEGQVSKRGTYAETAYEMYNQISMDTLSLFVDYIDAHDPEAKQQVDLLREYIRIGTADNNALKRQLRREGTPGWSEDSRRVLASYILSSASMAATNLHAADVSAAIQAIPQDMGDVKDYANNLQNYTQDPGEEFSGLRNFMFFWYLGGSLASAAVNLTQIPMVTAPYLTQFGSVGQVTAAIKSAYGMVGKGKMDDSTALGRAYLKAEQEGYIAPQQIYAMMGTARGGTLGAGRILRHPGTQWLLNFWSTPFAWAEQVNRSVTFIAAYNLASQSGKTDSAAFDAAVQAINETQFVYDKTNRPVWARGLGAPLFTFKTFTIQYLELLSRLPAKQQAMMIGMMLMVAGLGGLPGEEDAEDIIDTIMQVVFGKAWHSRTELNNLAENLLGETLGAVVVEGAPSALGPIDFRRLGMGNIIPGTGALLPGADTGGQLRAAGEVLGPTTGLIQDAAQAITKIGRGEFGSAGYNMIPKAMRNWYDGFRSLKTGTYEDAKGRTVMPVGAADAWFKVVGFQPRKVAEYQQAKWQMQKRAGLQRTMEDAFLDRMARAKVAGDQAAYQAARQEVDDWNKRNPNDTIKYSRTQVITRVKAIKAMSRERFLKSMPSELREEAAKATR